MTSYTDEGIRFSIENLYDGGHYCKVYCATCNLTYIGETNTFPNESLATTRAEEIASRHIHDYHQSSK